MTIVVHRIPLIKVMQEKKSMKQTISAKQYFYETFWGEVIGRFISALQSDLLVPLSCRKTMVPMMLAGTAH